MKKLGKLLVIALSIFGLLSILAGAFIFYNIKYVDYKYTGEELFQAINSHREQKGLNILELDPKLCDNLVERYWAIKESGNAHKGYEEWLKSEGIVDDPKYGVIGEIYVVDVSTPQNAITWWSNSPGHRTTLEMQEMKYGCAYANDGAGVVIMATPKEKGE